MNEDKLNLSLSLSVSLSLPLCLPLSLQETGGTSATWPIRWSTGPATSPRAPWGWPCALPSSCGATFRAWCSGRSPGARQTSGWPFTRETTTTGPATPLTAQVGGPHCHTCSQGPKTLPMQFWRWARGSNVVVKVAYVTTSHKPSSYLVLLGNSEREKQMFFLYSQKPFN